jgi:hypothetical protein
MFFFSWLDLDVDDTYIPCTMAAIALYHSVFLLDYLKQKNKKIVRNFQMPFMFSVPASTSWGLY